MKCLYKAHSVDSNAAFISFYAGRLFLAQMNDAAIDPWVQSKVISGLEKLGITSIDDIKAVNEAELESNSPKHVVFAIHLARLLDQNYQLPDMFAQPSAETLNTFDLDVFFMLIRLVFKL